MTYRKSRTSWYKVYVEEEVVEEERENLDHAEDNELQSLGWYHDNLSRHAAEALLLTNGKDGSYLLRNSDSKAGQYSLSVRAKDSVKHFHVIQCGSSIKFGFNEFPSIKDFIQHFANQPLIGSESGTLILLKYPYPREVEEPSIYESVRVHTAMQTGRSESDLVPVAPSLGTKEGFLTKQGGRVKSVHQVCWSYPNRGRKLPIALNWCVLLYLPVDEKYFQLFAACRPKNITELKAVALVEWAKIPHDHCRKLVSDYVSRLQQSWKTRWFILSRNELKYFKDRLSSDPIRTLDLKECSAVQFDYSQEKVNCFCLVFPLRTYYLCAKTGAEADEWIKILRWKISQIKKHTR